MKRLLVLLTIIASSTTFATLKYDPMTDRVSSVNAAKNVDQNEYHNLAAHILMSIRPRNIYQLSNHEIAEWFSYLKACGTPAAKQLIRDLEELLKEHKKNIARVQKL
jgi:hypothetical protein